MSDTLSAPPTPPVDLALDDVSLTAAPLDTLEPAPAAAEPAPPAAAATDPIAPPIARRVLDVLTGQRALKSQISELEQTIELQSASIAENAELRAADAARIEALEAEIAGLRERAADADRLEAALAALADEAESADEKARATLAALGVPEETLPAAAAEEKPRLTGRERMIADFQKQAAVSAAR
jgi:predicted  nucleic acid-binding Zn-ribbon protein